MKISALIICVCVCAFGVKAKPLDSLRIETTNGKKFIIHKIDKGQGLYAVARKYAVDVKKIMDANPGKTDKINAGDLIRIPFAANNGEENAEKKTEIANIAEAVIKDKRKPVNRSKQGKLIPDSSVKNSENLNIDDVHANADSKEVEKVKMHTVTQGESINKIALKYNITPQLIIQWNGLRSNKIEPGQLLIVDGSLVIKPYEKWNAPNSVSAKSSSPRNILSTAEIIEETGFADIGADKMILHRNASVGTLILITNLENGNQCYARVTGKLEKNNMDQILILDSVTKQKLKADSSTIRIKIKYTSLL